MTTKLDRVTALGPDGDEELGDARLTIGDDYATIKFTQAIGCTPRGWPVVASKRTDDGVAVVYTGEVAEVEQTGSMAGMRAKLRCVPARKHDQSPTTQLRP